MRNEEREDEIGGREPRLLHEAAHAGGAAEAAMAGEVGYAGFQDHAVIVAAGIRHDRPHLDTLGPGGGLLGYQRERRETGLHLTESALKRAESLVVRSFDRGGIREAPMNALGSAGKHRALLGGGVADGDHVVERLTEELSDVLRSALR